MKKIVYILMMFVIAISAQAQTGTQARQILDKTAAVVGNKNGAQAKFSMS